MAGVQAPVSRYMHSPVRSVRADATLAMAARAMELYDISSLAVADDGRLLGIITRSDLLRLEDPRPATVAEAMTEHVVAVGLDSTLSEAARRMTESHIHRVFVVDDTQLAGVLSPHEILRAIVDARLPAPISEYATRPVVTVSPRDLLAVAIEGLELAHVSGLVVVESGWPVGVFTQREALAARSLPPQTELDGLYSAKIACMPTTTPLHRAASQAVATRVQRVLAMLSGRVDGILSGIDFARAIC